MARCFLKYGDSFTVKSPAILRTTTCLTVESEKLSHLRGDSLCSRGRELDVLLSWSPRRHGDFVLYEGWADDNRNWQWKQYHIKMDLLAFEMSLNSYHQTCGNSLIFYVLRVNIYVCSFMQLIGLRTRRARSSCCFRKRGRNSICYNLRYRETELSTLRIQITRIVAFTQTNVFCLSIRPW
jgi:hypothetical protein